MKQFAERGLDKSRHQADRHRRRHRRRHPQRHGRRRAGRDHHAALFGRARLRREQGVRRGVQEGEQRHARRTSCRSAATTACTSSTRRSRRRTGDTDGDSARQRDEGHGWEARAARSRSIRETRDIMQNVYVRKVERRRRRALQRRVRDDPDVKDPGKAEVASAARTTRRCAGLKPAWTGCRGGAAC